MSAFTPRTQALGLAGWLLLTFTAAGIGAVASASAATFYAGLQRPDWAPPGWLFAPMWTTLYLLMGIAAWRVWRVNGWAAARGALTLFIAQLAANAVWTWLYFVWRLGAVSLAEVVLLWLMIAATMLAFRRHDRLAVWLLLPYLAWVGLACALTYATWQLNPSQLV